MENDRGRTGTGTGEGDNLDRGYETEKRQLSGGYGETTSVRCCCSGDVGSELEKDGDPGIIFEEQAN